MFSSRTHIQPAAIPANSMKSMLLHKNEDSGGVGVGDDAGTGVGEGCKLKCLLCGCRLLADEVKEERQIINVQSVASSSSFSSI